MIKIGDLLVFKRDIDFHFSVNDLWFYEVVEITYHKVCIRKVYPKGNSTSWHNKSFIINEFKIYRGLEAKAVRLKWIT